jgi:hypothetical protein
MLVFCISIFTFLDSRQEDPEVSGNSQLPVRRVHNLIVPKKARQTLDCHKNRGESSDSLIFVNPNILPGTSIKTA